MTGTLTNNTGGAVTIGDNNDTSDVANVGLLTNSGTVTVGDWRGFEPDWTNRVQRQLQPST